MKRCGTLIELQRKFANVKSGCTDDTLFMAAAFMFAIEQNEKLIKLLGGDNGKGIRNNKRNEVLSRAKGSSKGETDVSRTSNEGDLEVREETQTPE